METVNIIATEAPSANLKRKIKMAIIGFVFMLAGPILLFFAVFYTESFGYFSKTAAVIVSWTAIVLPGVGIVFAIIALFQWKKTKILGRALAIVTVVMCNPLFYLYYFLICGIASSTLAGLSWM